MSRYRLTPGAQAGLVDIYVYTHNTWGPQQADAYLNGLYACLDGIAARTVLWRPIPGEFEVEGFYTRHERHMIYWRDLGEGEIFIVAIMHTAMLQTERLRRAFDVGDGTGDP